MRARTHTHTYTHKVGRIVVIFLIKLKFNVGAGGGGGEEAGTLRYCRNGKQLVYIYTANCHQPANGFSTTVTSVSSKS